MFRNQEFESLMIVVITHSSSLFSYSHMSEQEKLWPVIKSVVFFPADIKMSGDVADSTDAQSALSQVETGKGLLFWGQKQKSRAGDTAIHGIMNLLFVSSPSFLAWSFSQSDPKGWVRKWRRSLEMWVWSWSLWTVDTGLQWAEVSGTRLGKGLRSLETNKLGKRFTSPSPLPPFFVAAPCSIWDY